MSRIKILDTLTANKIAAGEVIERPASVVKELVENSLDAAASVISVKIEEGGKSRIIVQDDGTGMSREDLKLAFKRHATSKISSADDLAELKTLGFRGEALASIAAVSRVTVRSRREEDATGTELVLEGGVIISENPVGCSRGTRIEVTDLFYNAPARKKFLFTATRESAAISEIISRLALSNTGVKLTYYNGSRMVLTTPGNNNLLEAIATIYGYQTAKELITLNYEEANLKIEGVISLPTWHRATSNYTAFFVNGRYIKDSGLLDALRDAYGYRLPGRRFPFAVIHIFLRPEVVDINVHPQKLTVKFDKPELIYSTLSKAVLQTLEHSRKKREYIPGIKFNQKPESIRKAEFQGNIDNSPDTAKQTILDFTSGARAEEVTVETAATTDLKFRETSVSYIEPEETYIGQQQIESLPYLRVMGQFKASYIVAEADNTLFLIDQHGAHERVLYHKYVNMDHIGYSQLSVPETLELTPEETGYLTEHIFLLQQLGFLIEHFGGNSFIIRATPDFISGADGKEVLHDIIQLLGNNQKVTEKTLRREVILQCSCKGAVKAGQYLDKGEMDHLLRQLAATDYPYSCPHGRPIIIKLTLGELKKFFMRQE
ncbi:MAG: DNA mismatch repair endonuclease MutL [Thermoanaerobacteraceae bacterium]|nr:DNA mismatch repair endonuclease MutL [Thermoanaerobacteraceae bacterium]